MYSCLLIFLSGYNHYSNRGENQQENPEIINIPNKLVKDYMKPKIKDKISKHWTSLLAPLPILFLQWIPSVIYRGIMLFPVLLYFIRPISRPLKWEHFYEDLRWLFCYPANIPGWAIAGFGFLLFLIALTSMLKKRGRLLTSGPYGKVRHPQYLGFIVMTWGISAVSVIWRGFPVTIGLPYFLHRWIVISLAYVGLAFLEERYLLKKHPQEYKEYKQKVPFLFPVPHPRKIPQPIFDLGIIILFSFVLQEIYPRIIQILI
jgi:protein-S-isoprenylcysteine O-methyltransferase Ste14